MKKIKNYIVNIAFKYLIRHLLFSKDVDLKNYLLELLRADERRMIGNKESLSGFYDLDIEMNRFIQEKIK